MCGRFIFFETEKEKIESRFDIILDNNFSFSPSYNIAPSEESLIIINENGKRKIKIAKWGFVPSWYKGRENYKPLINLRDDTLITKSNFLYYLKNFRCLIPANGFYEWKDENGSKKPYLIFLKNLSLFSFGGVYNVLKIEDKELITFAIITTIPNKKIEFIHNRMPLILEKENEYYWLDDSIKDIKKIKNLISSINENEIDFYEVSTLVNNPENKFKELIFPYKGDKNLFN
jgi:putative SOS response-associated peptidase YedK